MKIYLATAVTLLASGVVLVLPHQQQRRSHLLNELDLDDLNVEEMDITDEDIAPMLAPFNADIDDIIACQITSPIQFKAGELFGYDGEVTKAMHYMMPVSNESEKAEEQEEPEDFDAARMALLLDAINSLEEGNEAHWTNSGLPEVAALKEITGGTVSGAERDAAWAEYNKEPAE